MINHDFKRLFFLLLFAFWFWSVQVLPAQEINYKLVPNLQQMKDSAPTPDFTLPDPAGKKVSLKDFRGKLVMLNFWATWCVPCREEMPTMERL
jgi:thiol-disulfide isomerase/thioredoxin